MKRHLYAGIEAGGTKFACAVADHKGHVLASAMIRTTDPQETLQATLAFFRQQCVERRASLIGLGIASFGPLDLDRKSAGYGSVQATPKPAWSGTNLKQTFETALDVPVAIDLDVNGAALAEYDRGAGKDLENFVYYTVGTGIGASIMLAGKPHIGRAHSEMGHIRLPHDLERDPFPGCCPFHGDCLEGLASGVAVGRRWKMKPEDLPASHPAWQLEADYLAAALVNTFLTVAPQRIIMGGGVMRVPGLLEQLRDAFMAQYRDYPIKVSRRDLDELVVAPGLGYQSGLVGALIMARRLTTSEA